MAKIWTLKVSLVSGPGFNGEECTRFIEVEDSANLYDLHVAIMDAIHFEDDQPFAFFHAGRTPSRRSYIPKGVNPDSGEVDSDIYEDILIGEALPKPAKAKAPAKATAKPTKATAKPAKAKAKSAKAPAKPAKAPASSQADSPACSVRRRQRRRPQALAATPPTRTEPLAQELYYLYNFEDQWIFRITREPGEKEPEPGEFYPLVLDHLNIGPDPVENPGPDDFADAEEGFEFNETRRQDREIRRRALMHDDEEEGTANSPADDDDDFFDDDDEDDFGMDEEEDDEDEDERDPFFDDDEDDNTLFGHGRGRSSPGSDYDYNPDDQW